MRPWWCAALVTLVTFISCGGSGAEGPTDTSPEGVCAYYADKYCAADERCGPGFVGFWNDRPTCLDRVKLGCVTRLTATGVNDTPIRITDCANALAEFSCDKYNDDEHWPETCTPPPGQVADSAPCIVNEQCQGGWCSIRSTQPCGVCQTVAPPGGACPGTGFIECQNLLPCINGICTYHPRTGETCDEMNGLYCVASSVCKNADANGVGTCAAPTPAGGACDPKAPGGNECDVWHAYGCDEASKKCTTQSISVPIGADCSFTGGCNASGYCGPDFKCKALPREGQPCIPGDMDCMSPAKCINGVCKIRDAAACK